MIQTIFEYFYVLILLVISYNLIIYFNRLVKDDLCKI